MLRSGPNIWNFHLYILASHIFFLYSFISDIFLELCTFRFSTAIYSTRNIFWRERLGFYHFHSLFKHMETNGFKNKIIAFHPNIRRSKNRSISFLYSKLHFISRLYPIKLGAHFWGIRASFHALGANLNCEFFARVDAIAFIIFQAVRVKHTRIKRKCSVILCYENFATSLVRAVRLW